MTESVWQDLIEEMKDRETLGIERYGKPVLPFNKRSVLRDMIEEHLDAAVYTKQLALELEEVFNDICKAYYHLGLKNYEEVEKILASVMDKIPLDFENS